MKKKMVILLIGLFACFLVGQEAGASALAGPSASVALDWSTFETRLIDIGSGEPTISQSYGYDLSYASSGSSYQEDYVWDWTTGTRAEVWGSFALSETSAGVVHSTALLNGGEAGSAYSGSDRYGSYAVDGTGLLLVMVDYDLEVMLADGASGVQSAYASCYLELYGNNGYNYGAVSKYLYSDWNNIYYDTDSGKLVASLYVTDGMEVWLSAGTYAYVQASNVPVPATMWLLGSGLAGLLVTRRKRR